MWGQSQAIVSTPSVAEVSQDSEQYFLPSVQTQLQRSWAHFLGSDMDVNLLGGHVSRRYLEV